MNCKSVIIGEICLAVGDGPAAEALNKLAAQDEKGNILPVFCIRTFFESKFK